MSVVSENSKVTMRQERTGMWSFKHLAGKVAGRVLPIPVPEVVSGKGSVADMGKVIKRLGAKKPLIVTDKILMELGLVQPCLASLREQGFSYAVYDKVEPNPTTQMCQEAFNLYKSEGCDSLVAFGGGSPMDCAKVVGAMAANPKPIRDYQGMLNVNGFGLYPLPPFVAVPTTAGTGSETTVASIITVAEEQAKITIADLGLVPGVAVMDPLILAKLPKPVTAATGMDALTHAVEAFLGSWTTEFTERNSLMAVEKIFRFLKRTYDNGDDLEAREAMLLASFEAGLAFTRANVGYVHAIAHQFGGMFHTPHGVANAMVLPLILDFYIADEAKAGQESACTERFFLLAKAAGVCSSYKQYTLDEKREIAKTFVARIREMNKVMALPTFVKGMKAEDVRVVAERALREAHGELHGGFFNAPYKFLMDMGYPVPKHLTLQGCERIVAELLPVEEQARWMSISKVSKM